MSVRCADISITQQKAILMEAFHPEHRLKISQMTGAALSVAHQRMYFSQKTNVQPPCLNN